VGQPAAGSMGGGHGWILPGTSGPHTPGQLLTKKHTAFPRKLSSLLPTGTEPSDCLPSGVPQPSGNFVGSGARLSQSGYSILIQLKCSELATAAACSRHDRAFRRVRNLGAGDFRRSRPTMSSNGQQVGREGRRKKGSLGQHAPIIIVGSHHVGGGLD